MKWDRNEWQGRSENQVGNNNKIFGIAIIAWIITFFFLMISMLVSCKSTEKIDCDAYSNTVVVSKNNSI